MWPVKAIDRKETPRHPNWLFSRIDCLLVFPCAP